MTVLFRSPPNECEFYKTGMGRAFYERDIPAIARALNRIADSLERLIENQKREGVKKNE